MIKLAPVILPWPEIKVYNYQVGSIVLDTALGVEDTVVTLTGKGPGLLEDEF